MAKKKRKAIDPGEVLREAFLLSLGLSTDNLAFDLRVPDTRVADQVNQSFSYRILTGPRSSFICSKALVFFLVPSQWPSGYSRIS